MIMTVIMTSLSISSIKPCQSNALHELRSVLLLSGMALFGFVDQKHRPGGLERNGHHAHHAESRCVSSLRDKCAIKRSGGVLGEKS